VKLPQLDRLPLILAGALLAGCLAGCHYHRSQADGGATVSRDGVASTAGAPLPGSSGYTAGSTSSSERFQPSPGTWNENSTSPAPRRNGLFPPNDDFETDTKQLSPSPGEGEPSAGRTRRSLTLPLFRRKIASSAPSHSTGSARRAGGAPQVPSDSSDGLGYAAIASAEPPTGWTGRSADQTAREAWHGRQAFPDGPDRASASIDPGREPIRLDDPPRLRTTPTDGGFELRSESGRGLAIPRILVCRQVRGFEDVVPLDARRLRRGQPLLIYATLENFRSMATSKGYRTLTLSTLEIRKADGEVLQRQPLGTAVDLVEVPRRDFFLTHLITIPDDLPAGEYLFDLYVDDLLKHESATARVAVHVTEDRSPRDGMADISGSARRPAGFPK
jgi:hypothetical protein